MKTIRVQADVPTGPAEIVLVLTSQPPVGEARPLPTLGDLLDSEFFGT